MISYATQNLCFEISYNNSDLKKKFISVFIGGTVCDVIFGLHIMGGGGGMTPPQFSAKLVQSR